MKNRCEYTHRPAAHDTTIIAQYSYNGALCERASPSRLPYQEPFC
jgi:hypothetical protein|tara:strand:+ start:1017 stop:1151 length:135 start_codon:yes stop_codon:yes gene_type:complete